ncbi:hypothetical protein HQ487_04755 [Candidatus Uhrbacteria bacterium]|nr:hypothetical protein [Candidatus Uhrbacteria bacterium]
MKLFFQKPWFTTLLGVLAMTFILGGAFLYLFREHLPQSTFIFLGDRAFGDLSLDQAALSDKVAGSGGGATELSLYPVVSDWEPGMGEIEAYEYLYEGILPDLSTIDATVYRRVNTLSIPDTISSGFSQLTVGILPLSTFRELGVQNISFKEEAEDGFNIYLDIQNNSLSISRNEGYWLKTDTSRMLSATDIPSDEALIDAANRFLIERQIDITSYGNPSVDRSYIDADAWIPDVMNVVYPSMIHEQSAWTMWGQPSGLTVSVGLRTGKVESLWTTGSFTLEASTYELTTNPKEVLSVAHRGGLWEYLPENPDITYTFRLGEPSVVLAEHYQYDETTGSSTLYVPALAFPVVEADADAPFQRQWIIVPLVRDILDQGSNQAFPEPFVIEEDQLEGVEVIK